MNKKDAFTSAPAVDGSPSIDLPVVPVDVAFGAAPFRVLQIMRAGANLIRAWRSSVIDRCLGIDTIHAPPALDQPATMFSDGIWYEATDYLLLKKYMRPLRVGARDVVYEIGCGLGRTLCMFARRRVRKCIGIEFSPELARQAANNAAGLRGRKAPIEVRTGDAATADYSEGTVFWINNPFGPQTLRAVCHRIEASLRQQTRPMQIAYVYPFHKDVIESMPWLRRFHRERSLFHTTSEALYWSNRAQPYDSARFASKWSVPGSNR